MKNYASDYARAALDAEKGGECNCACHSNPNIRHAVPCCTPPAQAAEAVERVARAIAAVNNGHPDHTPQPTIDAFWGLLDADQQDRYRRMARAAIGAMGGGK
jgi:hypothetical protein